VDGQDITIKMAMRKKQLFTGTIINMKKNNYIILLFLIVSFVWVSTVTAQSSVDAYLEKYPGALAVCLKKEEHVFIDVLKDGIKTTIEHNKEVLHLSEQSKLNAAESVFHSAFAILEKTEAYTLVPKGKSYKKVMVNDFKDYTGDDDGTFYHDFLERKFTYPMVEKGTQTVLNYRKSIPEPRLMQSFYFYSAFHAAEIKFSIKTHKDVELGFKLFNAENSEMQYTFEDMGKYKQHTWVLKNHTPISYFKNRPSASYFIPHVIFFIKSYKFKEEVIPILPELKYLCNWYWKLTSDVRNYKSTACTDMALSIVEGIDDEETKVEKVLTWVQQNIRYVSFSDGMRGFVPNHPEDILRNRYGDCKDMSVLLYTLLLNIGIESHLTWIGTRDKCYSYNDIPAPTADNHMIVAYKPKGKETVFLDPTLRHGIYALPPSNLQGKEALICLTEWDYIVETVPITPLHVSTYKDTCLFRVDKTKLKGSGKVELDGYVKKESYYHLVGKTTEQQDRHIRYVLKRGGNKYHIDNYTIANLDNKSMPTVIDYDITIEDYVRSTVNEIFVNMNLDRVFDNDVIDVEKRKIPVEFSYYLSTVNVAKLVIPEGYEVHFIPENRSFQHDLFGFDISYKTADNIISQTKTSYIKYLLMYEKDFPAWNDFVKEISRAYRETVVLKKELFKN